MKITTAHGSGGKETGTLIQTIFAAQFQNPVLDRMEDAAIVPGSAQIAMTTDSFVVDPIFFRGGDIGRLAVCGTVNDLLVSGAVPQYLTCGFILEEGLDTDDLERVVHSMQQTAQEAGVSIVAGDTKVIEGHGGLYINTAGVGFVPEGRAVGARQIQPGDKVLVSGNLGDHHTTILCARLAMETEISSDCAPLGGMVGALFDAGIAVHAMRDITRGGLGQVLNEYAKASGTCITIEETQLPVSPSVLHLSGVLGLDPLFMGNEGKLCAIVAPQDAENALQILRSSPYGADARICGTVTDQDAGIVLMETKIGGTRVVPELYGEGLPRIC